MFKIEKYSELGGISIDFAAKDSSRSIGILMDSKSIKLSGPNKKGSFGWDQIKSLTYKGIDQERGILTVMFIKKVPGAESGYMTLGNLPKAYWARLVELVSDQLKTTEEKATETDINNAEAFSAARIYEWGGIKVDFSRGDEKQSITINKDPKQITTSVKNKQEVFNWDKTESIQYVKTNGKTGVLTATFPNPVPGTDQREFEIGTIDDKVWQRLRVHVNGEIKMTEE